MHCCSTHPHRAQHKCTGLHTRHTALLQSTQRQAFLCNDQHPLFCYNSDNKHTRKSIRSNKVNTMTSGAAGGAAAGTTPGQHDGQHDGELLDGYVAAFQEFAAIPTISKAQIQGVCDDAILMQVTMTQRDLPNNTMLRYTRHATLSRTTLDSVTHDASTSTPHVQVYATPPQQLNDSLLHSVSPTGDMVLIITKPTNSTAHSCGLEVWHGDSLVHRLQVPTSLHGVPYNDGWLGVGAAWAPGGRRVAYVAESPTAAVNAGPTFAPNRAPFTTGEGAKHNASGETSQAGVTKPTWKCVGEWKEDWGERLVGRHTPAVYVFDIDTLQVSRVEGGPDDASCGQPAWTPDGSGIVFTAWPHKHPNMPRLSQRLGMVYCFNRPAVLYYTPWPQPTPVPGGVPGGITHATPPHAAPPALRLTPPTVKHACLAMFSPDGGRLVVLSHDAAVGSGVHHATGALLSADWPGAVVDAPLSFTTTIPVVQGPTSNDCNEFPGLYASAFAGATFIEQPFIDDHHFITSTQWRSTSAIIVVGLDTGNVCRITPNNGAWVVHTVKHGIVLAVRSTPTIPCELYAALVPPTPMEGPWRWVRVDVGPCAAWGPCVRSALEKARWEIQQVTPTNGDQSLPVESVVIYNTPAVRAAAENTAPPPPGILVPHGGPHSAYNCAWSTSMAYLQSMGYTLVVVNYRGSTGFGEVSVQSLPGNIGTHDVEDCRAALAAAAAAGYCDPTRLGIVGGSHGGFLAASLVGQYPDEFAAAVLRNPVCDLSAMVHITDITDWVFIEAWGSVEGMARVSQQPTGEDMERFRAVSPVKHVGRIKAAMLFLLGAKDERVPIEDGKRMQWALKARSDAPPVRTIVFEEDNHALDRPQTEAEQFFNTAWWLGKYL